MHATSRQDNILKNFSHIIIRVGTLFIIMIKLNIALKLDFAE